MAIIERDKLGKFLPGSGGRRPGALNKLHASFIRDLLADWTENGPGVIKILRIEDPVAYARVIVSVLPREVIISEGGLEQQLTDDELNFALEELRAKRLLIEHDETKPN